MRKSAPPGAASRANGSACLRRSAARQTTDDGRALWRQRLLSVMQSKPEGKDEAKVLLGKYVHRSKRVRLYVASARLFEETPRGVKTAIRCVHRCGGWWHPMQPNRRETRTPYHHDTTRTRTICCVHPWKPLLLPVPCTNSATGQHHRMSVTCDIIAAFVICT